MKINSSNTITTVSKKMTMNFGKNLIQNLNNYRKIKLRKMNHRNYMSVNQKLRNKHSWINK